MVCLIRRRTLSFGHVSDHLPALGIAGLGPPDAEEGSGLLIMAIAGGAASALQGVLADRIGLQLSYILPAVCYVYVLFYALWGSKPTDVLKDERLV